MFHVKQIMPHYIDICRVLTSKCHISISCKIVSRETGSPHKDMRCAEQLDLFVPFHVKHISFVVQKNPPQCRGFCSL